MERALFIARTDQAVGEAYQYKLVVYPRALCSVAGSIPKAPRTISLFTSSTENCNTLSPKHPLSVPPSTIAHPHPPNHRLQIPINPPPSSSPFHAPSQCATQPQSGEALCPPTRVPTLTPSLSSSQNICLKNSMLSLDRCTAAAAPCFNTASLSSTYLLASRL